MQTIGGERVLLVGAVSEGLVGMGSHVRQKIAFLAEGLLAMRFRANERSLTSLNSQVKSVWRAECTYVEALMNLESTGARILFVAAVKLTHERFHPSVRQFVRLKMTFCDEMLTALRA